MRLVLAKPRADSGMVTAHSALYPAHRASVPNGPSLLPLPALCPPPSPIRLDLLPHSETPYLQNATRTTDITSLPYLRPPHPPSSPPANLEHRRRPPPHAPSVLEQPYSCWLSPQSRPSSTPSSSSTSSSLPALSSSLSTTSYRPPRLRQTDGLAFPPTSYLVLHFTNQVPQRTKLPAC